MLNEVNVPAGMTVIPGTNDYGTLFENDIVDGVFVGNKSNWVEFNNLDDASYWKTKVMDKMYNCDQKEVHSLLIRSFISRDPGNTGGDECVSNVNEAGDRIAFSGKIDWYEADSSLGRVPGNRVGVMIKFPENITEDQLNSLRIHIAGKVYTKDVLDEHKGKKVLWYYPLVKSDCDTFKVRLVWGTELDSQDFYIHISPSTVLKSKVAAE